MAEQWEYKVVPALGGVLSEGDMNQLGAQGWELVSVVQRVGGKLSNGFGDIGTTVTFVFKRRKPKLDHFVTELGVAILVS